MSRRIEQPAAVVLVPDSAYGLRPAEVRWRDRTGWRHYAGTSETLETYAVNKQWWEEPRPQKSYLYWRMLIPPAGEIILREDLDEDKASPKRWFVERIPD